MKRDIPAHNNRWRIYEVISAILVIMGVLLLLIGGPLILLIPTVGACILLAGCTRRLARIHDQAVWLRILEEAPRYVPSNPTRIAEAPRYVPSNPRYVPSNPTRIAIAAPKSIDDDLIQLLIAGHLPAMRASGEGSNDGHFSD